MSRGDWSGVLSPLFKISAEATIRIWSPIFLASSSIAAFFVFLRALINYESVLVELLPGVLGRTTAAGGWFAVEDG